MMEIHSSFRLDGRPYDRDSLDYYCKMVIGQNETPPWRRELYSFIRDWIDPARSVFEQWSSGTTGTPKPYRLRRKAMVRSARNTLERFGLRGGDRVLLCLPVRYIAGKMMAVRALVGGLDLVAVEPSGRPLSSLSGPVSFGAMVPLQVHETLDHGDNLDALEILLIGGGRIDPLLRDRLSRLERPLLYESFGMTETCTHVALRRINGTGAGNLFMPMKGVSLSQDRRGCLVIRAEGITGGPIYTNDLVEMDQDGVGFEWLGRADHVISTGGIKIIPELLEQKIRACIGRECLVLPLPDARLGESLLLVVESKDPDPPEVEWLRSIRESLPGYEIPRRILTVPEIPRNSSFKPDRKAALLLLKNG